MQVDVHQHLWTEPLLDALAARDWLPFVRRTNGLTIVHCAGESPYIVDTVAETPFDRARLVRDDGLDRAAIALSSPIGVEVLRRGEAEALIGAYLAGLAAAPERWRHLVRDAGDARVYGLICSDDVVNAWVICWQEDNDTGWHDHDESSGGIAVISGRVREERLVLGAEPRVRHLSPGEMFTVPSTAIHRALHEGDEPAVTIHAYSPPLRRMGAYRVGPEGELERQSLPPGDRAPAANRGRLISARH